MTHDLSNVRVGRTSRQFAIAPDHSSSRPPVPEFHPIRAGHPGRIRRLRATARYRRRPAAAVLALVAAALTTTLPGTEEAAPSSHRAVAGDGSRATPETSSRHTSAPARHTVAAPVRIADAAAVGLLKPGDHIDVIVGGDAEEPRLVARRARVTALPTADDSSSQAGALVVLSVDRGTATRLAGAVAAGGRLAVTLC